MKKSDLKQIADFVEERLEKKFQSIDQKLEGLEERMMTLVKTEVGRLDERISGLDERMNSKDKKVESIMSELKKKPDRHEIFDWTERRIAQLKFN